jgi:hypothetical protein
MQKISIILQNTGVFHHCDAAVRLLTKPFWRIILRKSSVSGCSRNKWSMLLPENAAVRAEKYLYWG